MSDYLAAGRLEDHPFAALVGRAYSQGATGELSLESGDRRRRVWFLSGNPVAVVSDDPRDHISRILLDHGKLSAGDADRLAALPETREALGGAEYLAKDALSWGVRFRFVNLCYDLFRWEEGDYAFREGTPPRDIFLLKIPAPTLVLKGVGYMARHALLEAVPDGALIGPAALPAAETPNLGPEEKAVLDECRPGRSVGDLLGAGWNDADQARQFVYAFSCLGLLSVSPAGGVDFAEPEPEPGLPAPPPDLTAPAAAAPSFSFPDEPPRVEPPPLFDSSAEPVPSAEDAGHPVSKGYPFEVETASAPFEGSGFGFDQEHREEGGAGDAPGEETYEGEPEQEARRGFHLPRAAVIALGVVAAAGVIGAGAWWWIGMSEPAPQVAVKRPAPPATPVPPPAPAPAPSPAPEPAASAAPTAPAAPPEVKPPEPPPVPVKVPAVATPVPPAPPAPAAAAITQAPKPAKSPSRPVAAGSLAPPAGVSERYLNGFEVLKAGDFEAAAGIWESLLAEEHSRSQTVLLLTACERETVLGTFRSLGASRPLFLVTKQLKGRSCYRICAGTYDSREGARGALAALPQELRAAGATVWSVADVLGRSR